MNDINDLLMFMYNAWTPETCQSIFGELGGHIWNKWEKASNTQGCHALAYFWTSLDTKRQVTLLEAAKGYFK